MPSFLRAALALAPAALAPLPCAAGDPALEVIRREIRELKENYQARLDQLEARLKSAEARAEAAEVKSRAAEAQAHSAVTQAAETPPPPVAPPRPAAAGLAAFNPAVSLVLQGRYANLSQDPERFAIAGFIPGGEIGPGRRGFSLSETELTLTANVDDKFYGNATISVSPENTASVEEAYALATALPAGLSLKAGRFFSGIGYLNEQHQHAWDFVDAPLAYQAFLGGQHGDDGVQLKWLAPTDLFLEFAAEAGSGENFPGSGRNHNGANAVALTARLGGDVGVSHSWRVGLSALRTHAEARGFTAPDAAGSEAQSAFTGISRVGIADFVYKYAPDGNPLYRNFKLQGEYFRRSDRGDMTFDADGALRRTLTDAYHATQSGWYLQGAWQFVRGWRVGYRYDRLDPGSPDFGANAANVGEVGFKPYRSTVMLDWSPSEFSRIRLQAAQDRSRADLTDNEFFIQYIMSLGAHGAHKF